MAVFEAENLTFTYAGSGSPALKGINFSVNQGEFILILGSSGSGKSTLLKLLDKEVAPVGEISGAVKSNAKSIGFVSQNPENTFVSQTVRGELAFALENLALKRDKITLKIGETASFFNLNNILDKPLCELSGGEKAAVAIAACVIAGSEALLLDEPFSQLDPKASLDTAALIKRLNRELGVTVLLISHGAQEVIDCCDKIFVMENGGIICSSSPKEATENSSALKFLPLCTQLFDERPLTVKEAIPLGVRLKEKDEIKILPPKKDAFIRLKNISFRYQKNGKDILNHLDYSAYSGKINSVIGSNGSGKTTLLKLIAGIKKPYSGKITAPKSISYMPQNVRFLFTKDSVAQEISETTARKLKIDELMNRHPYDLSAGQAQKLAFGILLEQNSQILLLDEPSKGLDEMSKKELKTLLYALKDEGKTIIMVTHDLDFAGEISDFVSFLCDGVISRAGSRREVFSQLDFYTTQVRRITSRYLKSAVSTEDIV